MSSGPLYPASLWSGLADGVVSCYGYDCYPMMKLPISKFQTGGLLIINGGLDGGYSTDLRLIFVPDIIFRLFAQPIAEHIQKRKYRNNCRGNRLLFGYYWSHSGWPISKVQLVGNQIAQCGKAHRVLCLCGGLSP